MKRLSIHLIILTILLRATGGLCEAQSFENSLGMKFVPAGTQGTLFSIWDTRVQDFKAFVKATGYDATKEMYSYDSHGEWGQHGDTWKNPGFIQGPTNPVVGISWKDAKSFCEWLTEKERKDGKIKAGQSYRLPTDAEWSKAVGLDEHTDGTPESKDGKIEDVYPWGKQWPPPKGAGNYGSGFFFGGDDYKETSPVGSFSPNKYGLYDMGGNAWQWCEDWYNNKKQCRVLRGGSWTDTASSDLLSSFRHNLPPYSRGIFIGFRCVLTTEN